MYTLERVNEVAVQLQARTDEALAEIRVMAEAGDPWALAVMAEWERLGDPDNGN